MTFSWLIQSVCGSDTNQSVSILVLVEMFGYGDPEEASSEQTQRRVVSRQNLVWAHNLFPCFERSFVS